MKGEVYSMLDNLGEGYGSVSVDINLEYSHRCTLKVFHLNDSCSLCVAPKELDICENCRWQGGYRCNNQHTS